MSLRKALKTELWPRRRHAWPLLLVTVPMYYAQFWLPLAYGDGLLGRDWRVHPFCMLLSRAPAVWAISAIWFAIDLFLVLWIDRALNRHGEPGRPATLFFAWQAAKIAFLFLCTSVLISSGPANPVFGPPTFD